MAVGSREGALPGRVPSIDLDELALSFAGRSDVADLWDRLQAGEQITEPRDRVLVLLAESRAHERAGRFDRAAASATTALGLAEAAADAEGAAGGLSHLAYAKYRMGLLEEATGLAEQALAHGAPHAHTVTALLVIGLIALDACRWEEARERFTTARSWSIEVGYRFGVMLALHNLSVVYFHTGRFDLADAAAADVGRLNAEVKYPSWAYPWTRAVVARSIGDRSAAREALDDLAALDPPAAFAAAAGRVLEVQLALDEDDVAEAERALVAARLEAERLGNPMIRAYALLVTSQVRRARDDAASALGWIDEAIEEVRRHDITTLDGWMQVERARVLWALGDEAAAGDVLRAALAAADDRSAAHIAAESSVLLAALATARGDADADEWWIDAAHRVRSGGYGFIVERERSLVVRPLAALLRRREPTLRQAAQELLDQLARAAPVPLHVTGLGRFAVSQGRRPVPERELRKRRAGELLRFLLLQRHYRAHRDVVIEALWPDQPAESGLASFHQASSQLRRILEPDLPDKFPSRYVRLSGDVVELTMPTGATVDLERFESLANEALRRSEPSTDELDAALALYEGELFPDDAYADWAASRRTALADLASSVAAALGAARLDEGDPRAALDVCTLAFQRDPIREDVVEVGMRAALTLGDRTTALRLYRRCEERLAEDLGVGPSTELRALAATIGA